MGKISLLPNASALDGTEEIPVVQDGDTVRASAQDIADFVSGGSGVVSVGTVLAPIDDEDQERPDVTAPVYWIMDEGVIPSNAVPGDIIWTADGSQPVFTDDLDASGFGFVIDEDNMASNSATRVPTQQSVKQYVLANIGAGGGTAATTTVNTTGFDNSSAGDLQELAEDFDAAISAGGGGGGGVDTGIVDAVNSTQSAANTTTEVTLATLIAPAGSVDDADTDLWIKCMGLMRNNVTSTHTYRLKANGTTIASVVVTPTNSGNWRPWTFLFDIANPNETHQRTAFDANFAGTQGYDVATGVAIAAGFSFAGMHTSALDFTGTVTFTFTVQMSVADTTNTDDLFSARLGKILPLA